MKTKTLEPMGVTPVTVGTAVTMLGVTQQGMVEVPTVSTDLVKATCTRSRFKETASRVVATPQAAYLGDTVLDEPIVICHRAIDPNRVIPAEVAPNEREVSLGRLGRGQRSRDPSRGLWCARHKKHAARSAIEAMHEVDACAIELSLKETGDSHPVLDARAAVCGQSRGFRDGIPVVSLMNQREGAFSRHSRFMSVASRPKFSVANHSCRG